LILVLAGCDLFQEKLEQDVPLGEFITWYGDRANDMPTAINYIRDEFLTVARKNSPEPRAVHTYFTNSSVRVFFWSAGWAFLPDRFFFRTYRIRTLVL
jgi:hypothetical protein